MAPYWEKGPPFFNLNITHLLPYSLLISLIRHKKCVQKLVEAGADISVHDNEGLTAVS